MIQNPLATTNNSVTQLFANCPDGANILTWNQDARTFDYNGYSGGSWDPYPDATLAPGQGIMFQNPGADYVVTFVGEVLQGANLTITNRAGFNMVGSLVPQAGLIQTDLMFAPGDGDNVLKWNQTNRSYDYWTYSGGWDPEEPTLQPGEACFIQTSTGGNWTRSFSVN